MYLLRLFGVEQNNITITESLVVKSFAMNADSFFLFFFFFEVKRFFLPLLSSCCSFQSPCREYTIVTMIYFQRRFPHKQQEGNEHFNVRDFN